MEPILFLCFVISFCVTILTIPYWIHVSKKANLATEDMNKAKKPFISTAGGITVMAGFLFGLLFYIALKTFVFKNLNGGNEILAILCVVLISGFIGLLDDVLGRSALRRWQRPLLCLIAAIPLVVINSGKSIMYIPLVGPVNLGLIYPLLLIPIAVSGAANGFDIIGGYNGLQTGLGIIILSTLGLITWMQGSSQVSIICFCMVFALLAFLIFNKFPAKVFDGNTLSYIVGALIACIAIVGNIERTALILFIPFFIELFLKSRGKMMKESYAIPNKDGSLNQPYSRIYGLEHLAIKFIKKFKKNKKVYEPEVVFSLWAFEIILAIVAILTI